MSEEIIRTTLGEERRRIEAETQRRIDEMMAALSARIVAIQKGEFRKMRIAMGVPEPDDFVN